MSEKLDGVVAEGGLLYQGMPVGKIALLGKRLLVRSVGRPKMVGRLWVPLDKEANGGATGVGQVVAVGQLERAGRVRVGSYVVLEGWSHGKMPRPDEVVLVDEGEVLGVWE